MYIRDGARCLERLKGRIDAVVQALSTCAYMSANRYISLFAFEYLCILPGQDATLNANIALFVSDSQ